MRVILPIFLGILLVCAAMSSAAYADITINGETLEGYTPSEIISTDVNIESPDELVNVVEDLVVTFVQVAIPIIAIAAVVLIIFNAIRNIFVDEKDRKEMRDILKNIIVNFFFIIFAWVIVELMVYLVLSGETSFVSAFFQS